jgi:large subunit ribosomal protein L19
MVNQNDLLWQVEQRATQKKQIPEFKVGDTVDVGVRIVEGEKTRIQYFNGVVIGRRGGGLREYFTVRRIVDGEGVERDFPMHSPAVVDVKVKRGGEVRRAKLFYLRDRVGKATRLREKIEETEAAEAVVAAGAGAEQKRGKKRGKKAKAERRARQAAAAEAAAKQKAETASQPKAKAQPAAASSEPKKS